MLKLFKDKRLYMRVFTVSLLLLLVASISASPKPAQIAIFKSRNLTPYNTALVYLEESFKAQGYDVSFVYYDLEAKTDQTASISSEIKDSNSDLVITLGTEATKAARENIKDIPIVFSVVLDPIGNSIVEDLRGSGTNVAGVALDVSVEVQFETLISVLPHAKKIGVLYDPQKTGRIVEEAEEVAEGKGLKLIKIAVFSEKDVPKAMDSLKAKIDALWAPVDNTVYTPYSADFILLFTLRNKIPFMAFSEQFVKAGALMGLRSDYRQQGIEAANIAVKILKGLKPSDMPVVFIDEPFLFLNQRVAQVIGVEFSPQVLKQAQEVFE